MDAILLKDVISQMKEGKPFSIRFVKLDKAKGTGGQLISVTKALLNSTTTKEGQSTKGTAQIDTLDTSKSGGKGKARHTINIKVEGIEHPVCVHLALITRFNGKKVLI
jgi:hypothetical protein